MLYHFKSRVTGDVLMLQPHAEHLLQIIGKHHPGEHATQGVLLPEQMGKALALLEDAVASEEAAHAQALAQAKAEHHHISGHLNNVGLHQRALPLMEMMRECIKDQTAIIWEV